MPKTYKITAEQRRLAIMVAAQTDYGCMEGDWECLEAAAHNAALLLKEFGEKTAAEERAERETEEEEENE